MSLSLLLTTLPNTAPRFGAGLRLGSGKAQSNRAPFEFYPTPPAATRALLSVERFEGSVWEPACGNGALARELVASGHDVVATDIVDWGYGQPGLDFLETREPRARHIITNPPYGHGLADDFVRHALFLTRRAGGRAAMLLNIASLCHPSRHARFVQHPPSVIYALDDCVCYPLGDPARASTYTLAHRYAWVIWDHGHTGETAFRWLSTAPFTANAQQKGEQS
jgi:hypothetical protein